MWCVVTSARRERKRVKKAAGQVQTWWLRVTKSRQTTLKIKEKERSFTPHNAHQQRNESLNSFTNLSTLGFPPWTLGINTPPPPLPLSHFTPSLPPPPCFRHAFYSLEDVAVEGGWCHGSMSLSQPSTQRMWIPEMRPPGFLPGTSLLFLIGYMLTFIFLWLKYTVTHFKKD